MQTEKAPQKLVSFTNSKADMSRIVADMKAGWHIISLVENDGYYVGVMEKTPNLPVSQAEDVEIFLPPRRKIRFLES